MSTSPPSCRVDGPERAEYMDVRSHAHPGVRLYHSADFDSGEMAEWSTKFAGSEFEHRLGAAESMALKGRSTWTYGVTRTPVCDSTTRRILIAERWPSGRLNSPGANLTIVSQPPSRWP